MCVLKPHEVTVVWFTMLFHTDQNAHIKSQAQVLAIVTRSSEGVRWQWYLPLEASWPLNLLSLFWILLGFKFRWASSSVPGSSPCWLCLNRLLYVQREAAFCWILDLCHYKESELNRIKNAGYPLTIVTFIVCIMLQIIFTLHYIQTIQTRLKSKHLTWCPYKLCLCLIL